MTVFDTSLNLYRKTIKRIRPLHVALHGVLTRMVIPVMERTTGLKTMPDDPFWFRLELLTSRHERETTRHLERLIQPGMVVLDIGAHVGYYARRFGQLVGPAGRVMAFEPHPRTFAILSQNVAQSANVTPVQLAVSETEGNAELYDYLMMSASGSLHYDESLLDLQKAHVTQTDIAPRISSDFPVEKFTVRTVALDDYLPEQGITQVNFIKMDIEGAEINALRGMQTLIGASPDLALIMEYNPQALHAFEMQPQDALNEVMAMGFGRVQVIEPDGTLRDITGDAAALDTVTEGLIEHMDVVNLLLTRS